METYKLSKRKQKTLVAEFRKLENRTERVKFLSRSIPHVELMINTDNLNLKYVPMLSGCSFTGFKNEIREFDTAEEAMQDAIKLKQQFIEEASSYVA